MLRDRVIGLWGKYAFSPILQLQVGVRGLRRERCSLVIIGG